MFLKLTVIKILESMSRSQVERVFRHFRLGTPGQIFLVYLNETASKPTVVCVMANSQFCIRKSSSSLSMTGTREQTDAA